MPITWRASDEGYVEVLFTDPYSIAESERVMKEIFAVPDIPRPLRFLIDVRQSTPPDIEFVTNAVNFWQQHVRTMWGARIAVIASGERQVDMAQMSERTAEARQLPFTLRVFDGADISEATKWLASMP